MWLVSLAHTAAKWISAVFVAWIRMSSRLPPMVYSAPEKEENLELDFGENKPTVFPTRRKARIKEENIYTYSQWNALPDILLEDIFSRLSIRERYCASQVCRNWNRIFYSRRVWSTFVLADRTLTRRKFNYYLGDQYVLDHHRTQLCLHRIARGIRKLVVQPMENFFNLYEFMSVLSYFGENYETLNYISTLDFTFGCEFANENVHERDKVFGTGGKLLEALKRLMNDLKGLKHLALQDLLLEKEEALYFLDDVAYNCCETLQTLKLVNCSKQPYAMLHPAVFVNLKALTLSPQHLSDELVVLLGSSPRLRDVTIVQTSRTQELKEVDRVSPRAWRECSRLAPRLRVRHLVDGDVKTQVAWQEGAPVSSVIYNTPGVEVSISCIFNTANLYCRTLRVMAYLGVPTYPAQTHFEDRADSTLILLARCCLFLDTLVIRDKISSATVLLLANGCKNLRRLVVRKRGLLHKCDWPHNPEWSEDFYHWLKMSSSSREKTNEEVSRLLDCRWQPLSDEEFTFFNV